MEVEIGRYTLDCTVDPRVQNNGNSTLIPIDDIGFVYNCVFKQKKAFEHSVESIRKVYPESKIYVVSDGGLDYTYMEDQYDDLKVSLEEDTVSDTKKLSGDNFKAPELQKIIKNGMSATLRRLEAGIEFCGNPEWICMTEPDVLIRGRISHPEGAKLLGTRVNYAWNTDQCLDFFMGMNELSSQIEGSIPVLRWGAVPVILHTETFLKALKVYKDNFEILDKWTEHHYNPGAFDLFIDLIFALVGEPEVFSDEFTECLRNPQWYTSHHPIVHQYREYYDDDDHFWK